LNVDIRVIEIGGSLLITAIFIGIFALVREFAGAWSNFGYVLLLLVFTAVMSFFGTKLAPYLSQ
jgi:hypothetical protein